MPIACFYYRGVKSEMLENCAQKILLYKDSIIREWREEVRQKLSSAKFHSDQALVDSLPGVLDNLALALSRASSKREDKINTETAAEHGEQRSNLGDYALHQVIKEYAILRKVVFRFLAFDGANIPDFDRDIVNEFIDDAIATSSMEFSLRKEEGLRQEHLEMKKAEQKIKETIARLNDEQQMRERFVATLTHDLRSPLTSAKMSAQLIRRRLDDPDAIKKMSERIMASMDRADHMIQDLLDVSRVKAGEKLPIEIHFFDLGVFMESIIEDEKILHGNRFIFIQSHAPIEGYWSSSALRRILENLISNAVKYGSREAPVTITLSQEGARVKLGVHNEGSYILPQEIGTLFDQFRRAESAEKSGKKGWGLGLTLVKGLVEAHQGRIYIESSEESGTCFCIELPRDARFNPSCV